MFCVFQYEPHDFLTPNGCAGDDAPFSLHFTAVIPHPFWVPPRLVSGLIAQTCVIVQMFS